jgi:hypothetical protein
MYAEITAAVQSLNTLTSLARTAYSVSTQIEKDQLRIQLNEALLDMQGKLFAMQAKMGELAEEKGKGLPESHISGFRRVPLR